MSAIDWQNRALFAEATREPLKRKAKELEDMVATLETQTAKMRDELTKSTSRIRSLLARPPTIVQYTREAPGLKAELSAAREEIARLRAAGRPPPPPPRVHEAPRLRADLADARAEIVRLRDLLKATTKAMNAIRSRRRKRAAAAAPHPLPSPTAATVIRRLEVIGLAGVVREIAARHHVPIEVALSYDRCRGSADVRAKIYKVMRERGMSYPEIGRIFGRDHTTIISGIKRQKEAA